MLVEQELLKFFLIFPHIYQEKDANKADAILIASYYYETYKLKD